MSEHMHDIAIVGAGPAGSAAAYFLARGGLDVALIDKATFPRDKTCGDGVSPRALHVLDQMGLLAGLAACSFRANRLNFYTPNSRLCAADVPRMNGLPGYTLIVPRFILDDEIRKRALEAGAKPYQMEITGVMKDGNRIVGVKSNGATVTAKLTVVATGAATRLLGQTGLLHGKPALMVAARQYFENLPPLADRLEFYFDHIPLPGYGWLFPTSPTSANIGAGYFGPRASSPRSLLENFCRDHPRVRELIKDARPAGPIKGYPLRVDFPDATVMAEGVLAVGEAVGLVNPFTGEGIDYALESGQIAAESILAAPNFTSNGLRDYPRRLNARFRNYFVVITRMRDIFYNTFMLNRLFGRGANNRYIRETVMNICFGETDPLQAFSPKMMWELLKP
jgi:geranylgeranyl reductase family protein